MGFFDLPPREAEPDDDDDEDEFFGEDASGGWIGAVVPTQFVLARNEQAVVVVTRMEVDPDGLRFDVSAHLRSWPRGRGTRRGLLDAHLDPDDLEDGQAPARFLRFGLAWPDGGRATNLERFLPFWPDATEPLHRLDNWGGSGSNLEYTWRYHASPLPTDGQLSFVCEWPEFGVEETRHQVDAVDLQAALARAEPLWPPSDI